jgi:hypothetical protein
MQHTAQFLARLMPDGFVHYGHGAAHVPVSEPLHEITVTGPEAVQLPEGNVTPQKHEAFLSGLREKGYQVVDSVRAPGEP